jgi:hypothetical protein
MEESPLINLRVPDPLLKPSGPFPGNLHQFVGHSVVGFRSKSLKSCYETAPGSTESKECQVLFQSLAGNPVRDQEILN